MTGQSLTLPSASWDRQLPRSPIRNLEGFGGGFHTTLLSQGEARRGGMAKISRTFLAGKHARGTEGKIREGWILRRWSRELTENGYRDMHLRLGGDLLYSPFGGLFKEGQVAQS